MIKRCRFLLISILLVGCQDPATEYFSRIEKLGFIPFRIPLGKVGPGTILRGKPSQLLPMGLPTRCFPDVWNGEPTELRWESDTDLPQTHYSAHLKFDASLNLITSVGTSPFTFKFNMEHIKKVDFEAKGASVEMIDQIQLHRFYQKEMDVACQDYLINYPFIVNGLFVKEMSFTFYTENNGKIEIDTDKIDELIDFSVDIEWHIEKDYKLVITSPKYIGYHLAQLREQDGGLVNQMSTTVDKKNDLYLWQDLNEQPELSF